ncbi:hypothetical protein SAMN02800692_1500 [Luteibacter sp. UNC138MFCol5.1]|uniref:hypothetical protein n=1 Tax=Luteibacter sp. UNC138MFCol5.1 TaxID=1502774 RepID=UPI0008C42D9F|nr:hypothetical protein [Luteibacter sp. UNC138MFCol5.1]SEO63128.1 hypothetical protein SAMN02800692_1500 [Luteibacter sp. UNC138MFCol5.1]
MSMTRYQQTHDPAFVLDRATGTLVPIDGGLLGDLYRAWIDAGNVPDPVPTPSFDDYVARFTPGLQAWMELTAQTNAYDSVLSCVSYKDSGVPQFAGDAAAMIAWRDALWRWASQWQAGFNGQLPDPIPTLEEVIALAPQPEAFGWLVHAPGTIIEVHAPIEQPA